MRIGIFSRNFEDEDKHENKLLFQEIVAAGHEPELIKYGPGTNSYTALTEKEFYPDIVYDKNHVPHGIPMPEVDVVIPRVNETSFLNLALNALRVMAAKGTPLTNNPDAIRVAKDKAQTVLELALNDILTPYTILPTSIIPPSSDKILRIVQPDLYGPVAIKKTHGTIGRGTKIQQTVKGAKGVLDDNNEPTIIQEFIETADYPKKVDDIRILVIDGEAVEWYGRETEDDFRDNLYLVQDSDPNAPPGPVSVNINPSERQKKLATKAARVLGLREAGIDMFVHKSTRLDIVSEVNPSPGFGIDERKARNIAKLLIADAVKVAEEASR